jgi:hypothetical protein
MMAQVLEATADAEASDETTVLLGAGAGLHADRAARGYRSHRYSSSERLPAVYLGRGKTRQAACLSNLKQLCVGLSLYVQDYEESLPIATSWRPSWGPTDFEADPQYGSPCPEAGQRGLLQPYLKNDQIWFRPSVGPGWTKGPGIS